MEVVFEVRGVIGCEKPITRDGKAESGITAVSRGFTTMAEFLAYRAPYLYSWPKSPPWADLSFRSQALLLRTIVLTDAQLGEHFL
jgi:hypothetical protein